MRRLLSLVLLAAIGLPIVAPAFALAQDPDAGLPICCRRHGKHHCALLMDMRSRAHSGPQAVAVCPFYPQNSIAPVVGAHPLLLQAASSTAAFASALTPAARATTHRRVARERSLYKRGPPTQRL
ncbi:MAG TPA: hypothetical protein VHY48_03390 [Acidobacteriaceae bacterium]|nr:hypothetical protein [Acidobacteriaceae bacterium]